MDEPAPHGLERALGDRVVEVVPLDRVEFSAKREPELAGETAARASALERPDVWVEGSSDAGQQLA
jgi:hypothetical protein